MRAGARESVLESDHEELRVAVRTHAKVTFGTGELGQVVTIFGAKGGVGATAIATNLAGAMQRRSLRVCLVDLDLYLGDVLAFLDIPGSYSITDVLANMSRLDRDLLASSVTKHRSGVNVLAQSSKVEEAEQIKAPDVAALLEFLRRNYDFVIVESAHAVDDHEVVVAAKKFQQRRHVGGLDLLGLFDLAALREHVDARAVLGHRRGQQIAIEPAHVGEHVGDRVAARDVQEGQHVAQIQIEIDQADAQRSALHGPGQVGGDGGGAHAPLGAEDGDHLPELAGAEGDLGVGAHRHPQLLVIALEHGLPRPGPHRAQDQLCLLYT